MKPTTFSHILFPPLHEEDDSESEEHDILSSDLRSNFEQLRNLLPSSKNNTEQENIGVENTEGKKRKHAQQDFMDEPIFKSKKRSMNENTDQHKHQISTNDSLDYQIRQQRINLATKTYASIQNEFSILCSGIAELEAMLVTSSENINCAHTLDNATNNNSGVDYDEIPHEVNAESGKHCSTDE